MTESLRVFVFSHQGRKIVASVMEHPKFEVAEITGPTDVPMDEWDAHQHRCMVAFYSGLSMPDMILRYLPTLEIITALATLRAQHAAPLSFEGLTNDSPFPTKP